MTQVVPLFLPADFTSHLRRLKQEHSAELSALLKPLEQLSLSEREAVGAAGIAQAAALAWEANEDVFAALLPPVQRTLALPAPGIDDWVLPEPADAGTYDSAQQAVKHVCLHASPIPWLWVAVRESTAGHWALREQPATAGEEPLFSCGRRRSCWPTWRATGVLTALRYAGDKTRSN